MSVSFVKLLGTEPTKCRPSVLLSVGTIIICREGSLGASISAGADSVSTTMSNYFFSISCAGYVILISVKSLSVDKIAKCGG